MDELERQIAEKTAEFAKEIGADFYAKDAQAAVEIAKKII